MNDYFLSNTAWKFKIDNEEGIGRGGAQSNLCFFPVDNTKGRKNDPTFKVMMQKIEKEIDSSAYVHRKIPLSWLKCIDAIKEKKGVILVTGHFGLWELWGSWLGLNKYKIWGIIQRQKNLGADLFFKQKRESYGINHIYRRSSLDVSYNALNNGEILILASDQNAKQKGVKVNFFNHSSSTPKGAAIFHLRTKAPIIFSVLEISNEDQVQITFKKIKTTKESSVESITQDYTSKLEDFVHKNPSHYFWFHNKWKE